MASPNPEDIYSLIGFALTYIQSVEKSINFVTTYVLQDDAPLTIHKLNSIEAKERKKALGYFIGKVKERANLAPSLEKLLTEFLQNRNDFIHNQDKIPGWDLSTDDGVKIAKDFTINLWRQAHKINEIFAALVVFWQEQTGIYSLEKYNECESSEYFKELNEKYGSIINVLFTSKT